MPTERYGCIVKVRIRKTKKPMMRKQLAVPTDMPMTFVSYMNEKDTKKSERTISTAQCPQPTYSNQRLYKGDDGTIKRVQVEENDRSGL